MKNNELRELINSLSCDIEFEYNDIHGAICPFSRSNISLSYGEDEHSCISVDEAMSVPLFSGKSLNDISEKIIII